MVTHLTSSRFFGGPERQMLGLAQSLPSTFRTSFVSFRETGLCEAFLDEVRLASFEGVALRHDTPHLLAARKELIDVLRRLGTNVLCCHGYKANLLGLLAARRIGIPVIAVSRGWTGECFRIRLYEVLDRRVLRWMDKVVCVSAAQAEKVRRSGVRQQQITVIHNAIRPERFATPDPAYRDLLCRMFPEPPARIVGAAGRLSPEKGFDILIAAAQILDSPLSLSGRGGEGGRIGFILFGDGPLRDALARQIAAHGLKNRFILAGFRPDLDCYLPHLDLFVQSSFTEGLPNVILEAQAAGVSVVATSVGGTPEVIEDGRTGWLVPPRDAAALAERIARLLADDLSRATFRRQGRADVEDRFSFTAQSRLYENLFATLLGKSPAALAAAFHVESSAGTP
ncbi:MAG: glycosyltransferase [Planctomycetota bacterium]